MGGCNHQFSHEYPKCVLISAEFVSFDAFGPERCTLLSGAAGGRARSELKMLRVQGREKKIVGVCAVPLFSSLRTFGRTAEEEGGERERTTPFSLVIILYKFTFLRRAPHSLLLKDNTRVDLALNKAATRSLKKSVRSVETVRPLSKPPMLA